MNEIYDEVSHRVRTYHKDSLTRRSNDRPEPLAELPQQKAVRMNRLISRFMEPSNHATKIEHDRLVKCKVSGRYLGESIPNHHVAQKENSP